MDVTPELWDTDKTKTFDNVHQHYLGIMGRLTAYLYFLLVLSKSTIQQTHFKLPDCKIHEGLETHKAEIKKKQQQKVLPLTVPLRVKPGADDPWWETFGGSSLNPCVVPLARVRRLLAQVTVQFMDSLAWLTHTPLLVSVPATMINNSSSEWQ